MRRGCRAWMWLGWSSRQAIKIAADKRDVPYRSLIKMWPSEKVG